MKPRKVKGLDPATSLTANAARIVRVRAEELRSFAPEALTPDATEAQHDMRIAAKRLRYVLEVTGPCLGKPAIRARKRARDLQNLLGEIHDCDVMLPRVEEQLDSLRAQDARATLLQAGDAEDLDPGLVTRAPNRGAYLGLELLEVHLRARRALLFERFRQFWQAEVSKATWARLERAVEEILENPEKADAQPSEDEEVPQTGRETATAAAEPAGR